MVKLLVVGVVLLVILFAVCIGVGVSREDEREGSPREDSESFQDSDWKKRLGSFFSPPATTKDFTKERFPFPISKESLVVEASDDPLRVVTFVKEGSCRVEVHYLSPADERGDLNPQTVKPRDWEGSPQPSVSVTLLPKGGTISFSCETHASGNCSGRIDLKK